MKNRCPNYFSRGRRRSGVVYVRWQCPRKKLKGLPYCSYCEPSDKKRLRLESKPTAQDVGTAASNSQETRNAK